MPTFQSTIMTPLLNNVRNLSTVDAVVMQTTSRLRVTAIKLAEVVTFDLEFLQQTPPLFLDTQASLALGVGDASLRMHRLHDVLQFFETTLKKSHR